LRAGKAPAGEINMTTRFRRSLGALCLVQIMATATFAAPTFVLPPLVQPAGTEHHPGKVIWADLVTPDIVAAKRFYGQLFGWTFNDVHTGASDYSVALLDGNPVGGLFQRAIRPGEHQQPAWLTFISVRDVAAAGRTILAHGGKRLTAVRSYPDRGQQAVFADPQGAIFAVLQSSSGDPEDVLAAPGEWIWSSVLTRDPDTDAAFYQDVFGYEVFDIPSNDGSTHILLSTDDYARASLNALPADAAKRHPHWLNFVRVESATDAAARAEALGGRVLVKPFTDRHGGLVAVVADPAGAPFGLLEWTDSDSKQGAK
jgi:predicted enzyme related to lactoylglutathione lyase